MEKLILRFNAGGKCQLCGRRRETGEKPTFLKRTIQLITNDCIILMQVCFACLTQNIIEAIGEDCIIDKEFKTLNGHELWIEAIREDPIKK